MWEREREWCRAVLNTTSANVGHPASEPAGHTGTQQAWLSPPLGTVTGAAGCVHIQAYSTLTLTLTQAARRCAAVVCYTLTRLPRFTQSMVGELSTRGHRCLCLLIGLGRTDGRKRHQWTAACKDDRTTRTDQRMTCVWTADWPDCCCVHYGIVCGSVWDAVNNTIGCCCWCCHWCSGGGEVGCL